MHVEKYTSPNTAEGKAISSQKRRHPRHDLHPRPHPQPLSTTTSLKGISNAPPATTSPTASFSAPPSPSGISSASSVTPITRLYQNIQRYLTTAQRAHHRDRLNIQQYRAELRAEQVHKTRMENSETSDPDSYPSEKF